MSAIFAIKEGWQLKRERLVVVQGDCRIMKDVIMAGITRTLFVILEIRIY